MTTKQLDLTIYLAAAALAISVFLPLTRLPVIGEVSYYTIASLESYLIVACSIAAGALIIGGSPRLTILSAVGTWIILLFPAIEQLLKQDSSLLSSVRDRASSAATEFAADLFMNVAEFSWGGLLFLISLMVFSVTSLWRCFR